MAEMSELSGLALDYLFGDRTAFKDDEELNAAVRQLGEQLREGGAPAVRTPRERMAALADAQPLPVLCATLLAIDAEPELTEADRLARAVTTDAITARCPAARAALEAWAGDVKDPRSVTRVVIDAVQGARL